MHAYRLVTGLSYECVFSFVMEVIVSVHRIENE